MRCLSEISLLLIFGTLKINDMITYAPLSIWRPSAISSVPTWTATGIATISIYAGGSSQAIMKTIAFVNVYILTQLLWYNYIINNDVYSHTCTSTYTSITIQSSITTVSHWAVTTVVAN